MILLAPLSFRVRHHLPESPAFTSRSVSTLYLLAYFPLGSSDHDGTMQPVYPVHVWRMQRIAIHLNSVQTTWRESDSGVLARGSLEAQTCAVE